MSLGLTCEYFVGLEEALIDETSNPRSGTGASCIYPLLGCSQRPKWRFVATGLSSICVSYRQHLTLSPTADIDEQNMEFARRNIIRNNLESRIRPMLTQPHGSLIPLDQVNLQRSVSSLDAAL